MFCAVFFYEVQCFFMSNMFCAVFFYEVQCFFISNMFYKQYVL
jgi:hypothetical protein